MIFKQGLILRKLTYSIKSRRFEQNLDPAQKARPWSYRGSQMEFCNYLIRKANFYV